MNQGETKAPVSQIDRTYLRASSRPLWTSTVRRMGSAAMIMPSRKRKPQRISPVASAMPPMMSGPMKDELCGKHQQHIGA